MILRKTIVFTGLMGSGKTAVGQRLAIMLGVPFYDTDALIEQEENISIKNIFSLYGESYFRSKERVCVQSIDWKKPSIIASGGGLFIDRDNQNYLLTQSYVIFLSVPKEILQDRLQAEYATRPLLERNDWIKHVEQLQILRVKEYEKAHWICSIGQDSIEQVCIQLITFLKDSGIVQYKCCIE